MIVQRLLHSPGARALLGAGLLALAALAAACSSEPRFAPPDTEISEPELRLELLQMARRAQDARQELIEDGLRNVTLGATFRLQELDGAHALRLQQVVIASGWPGRARVGRDGAEAAFLIASSVEHDPPLQKKLAQALAKAWGARQVEADHYAWMVDLVQLAERGLQVYGTQTAVIDGVFGPLPLANPTQVNQRRAALGLDTLAAYLQRVQLGHRPGRGIPHGR